MKKKVLSIFLLSFLTILPKFCSVSASVPKDNKMNIGEITDSLPVVEMRNFFTKMEHFAQKIFGPPFSNVNLKIAADLNGTVHDTGFIDNEQTLILAGQTRDYQKNKLEDKDHALKQIYGSMLHELSHARYYYGNKRINFHPQWVNEGWAKLQEILLAKELNFYNFGTRPYFNFYLDRDTVGGTINWGSSKQTTNHSLAYDITSVTHLVLLSAMSTSNDNLDFFQTFNNKVYDWVKENNKTEISLEEYKNIMRPLLQGKTIDGQSAFDWYFNNPDSLTQGKMGNHLGITTEPGEIVAYAFNRVLRGQDIEENPLPNLDISIKAVSFDDKILLEKTVKTDNDGNARIDLPENENLSLMTLEASTTIGNKLFTARTFYFNAPAQDEKLSGFLIDETGKPISSKYIGLLKSDLKFDYKDKGVFIMTIPITTRTVTLDFLGYKQEITKGPFSRMFVMTVPEKYIEEAAKQSDSILKSGLVNNNSNQKNTALIIGVIILITIVIGAFSILKVSFKRRK